mgnify:CR=1 FL=1
MKTALTLALAVSLLAACDSDSSGSDAGSPGVDAFTPMIDSGPGTGIDSGPGTGIDSGPGTGVDSGPGTGVDSGPSTGADAGGGATIDGPDPRPGYVGCGEGTSCMNPQVCCVSLSGLACTAASACSGGLSAAGNCDGPEDCSGGQACCVAFSFTSESGTFCRDGGGCPSGENELCTRDADCSGSGATCVGCVAPGSSLVYGICTTDGSCPSPYSPAP